MRKCKVDLILFYVLGFVSWLAAVPGCGGAKSGSNPDTGRKSTMLENEMNSANPSSRVIRILALGDSYTFGEGVPPEHTWPTQLAERLREKGWPVDDPVVVARTGWTTDELLLGLEKTNLESTFDWVFLLIGVNNQYRGRDLEEYRSQLRILIEKALDCANRNPERVIVLSIPDWGVTPFASGRDRLKIAREIDAFNEINLCESRSFHAQYVDVTPISRLASEKPLLLAKDGLHPSGAMYGEWVELILPLIEFIRSK